MHSQTKCKPTFVGANCLLTSILKPKELSLIMAVAIFVSRVKSEGLEGDIMRESDRSQPRPELWTEWKTRRIEEDLRT